MQISGEVLARPSSQVNSVFIFIPPLDMYKRRLKFYYEKILNKLQQEENGDIEILVESIGKLNPELPIPTEEKIDVDVPEVHKNFKFLVITNY